MTFKKINKEDGYEIELNGEIIYSKSGRRRWPDKDAYMAILDQTELSKEDKSIICDLLIGPEEIVKQNEE